MRLVLIMLAAATLSACAGTAQVGRTPHWDGQFGANTRTTLARQIIAPDAARNTAPVAGMDGRAAHAAYERYQRSFSDAQSQAPAFLINGNTK